MDQRRHQKLRRLVKTLNRNRRKQAKQIDLLCGDFITAHRGFLRTLDRLTFAADFYEAVIGTTDLDDLVNTALGHIQGRLPEARVACLVRKDACLALHTADSPASHSLTRYKLLQAFTLEMVEAVCRENRICTLDEIFALAAGDSTCSFAGNWAAAVPLAVPGFAAGLLLLLADGPTAVTDDRLSDIAAVAPALARAVRACTSAQAHNCPGPA